MDKTQQIRRWAEVQIALCQRAPQLYFKEREIWWGSIGINVGHEQDGRNYWCERPVLVLKKHTQDTALVVPATSRESESVREIPTFFKNKRSVLLLDQSRVISSQRFSRKIAVLPTEEFENIKNSYKNLI